MAEKRKRESPSTDGRISFTSSKEYLCAVFYEDGEQRDYGIYRWKLNGNHSDDEPDTRYFRLPAVDNRLSVGAFASIGSKIYMIGGSYTGSSSCSTDIFVVETEKLHTKDAAQIVTKLSSVLKSRVEQSNAVAVGGKIYIFPVSIRYAEDSPPSRFEVFDPETGTTRLLPEPDFLGYGIRDYFAVFKTHILFCSDGKFLFAFDTARENSVWRDLSADFARISTGIRPNHLLPFLPIPLKGECATALGGDDDGSRLFGTVRGGSFFHGIVKFGDKPLRIDNLYTIYGIPEELLGKPCFAHGGRVFFTYIEDDRPKSGKRVWIFKKYSLSFHSAEDEDYYSALTELSFKIEHPCSYDYDSLACFVTQVPS